MCKHVSPHDAGSRVLPSKLCVGWSSLFIAATLAATTYGAGVVSRSIVPTALDGYCPVTLLESRKWSKGAPQLASTHRGRRYLFAGPKEKERFVAKPDIYSPVASCCDVVLALEKERLVEGTREHGVFYDGRVYLFAHEASLESFNKNPKRYAEFVHEFAQKFAGQDNAVSSGSDDSRTFYLTIKE